MPVPLTNRVITRAEDAVTKPIYLVELGFDPILRFSSGPDIVWDNVYWEKAPIQVGSIDNDAVGGQSVTLRIANHDRKIGAFVLSQVAQDRLVKVWFTYEIVDNLRPILFAKGVMDGAKIGEFVDISVISESTVYGSTPRIICGPPLMNHLPESGTVIKTGNVTIKIESR